MKKEKGLTILTTKNTTGIYDVVKTDKVIKYKYSKLDGNWAKPGQSAARLEDTGDGLILEFYNVDKKIEKELFFNYCQASELMGLLNLFFDNTTFEYLKRK